MSPVLGRKGRLPTQGRRHFCLHWVGSDVAYPGVGDISAYTGVGRDVAYPGVGDISAYIGAGNYVAYTGVGDISAYLIG